MTGLDRRIGRMRQALDAGQPPEPDGDVPDDWTLAVTDHTAGTVTWTHSVHGPFDPLKVLPAEILRVTWRDRAVVAVTWRGHHTSPAHELTGEDLTVAADFYESFYSPRPDVYGAAVVRQLQDDLAALTPRSRLNAVHDIQAVLKGIEAGAVTDLRSDGVTWEQIGTVFGTTRQTVQKRFGG